MKESKIENWISLWFAILFFVLTLQALIDTARYDRILDRIDHACPAPADTTQPPTP